VRNQKEIAGKSRIIKKFRKIAKNNIDFTPPSMFRNIYLPLQLPNDCITAIMPGLSSLRAIALKYFTSATLPQRQS